jgi:hypothetical protein
MRATKLKKPAVESATHRFVARLSSGNVCVTSFAIPTAPGQRTSFWPHMKRPLSGNDLAEYRVWLQAIRERASEAAGCDLRVMELTT